MSEKRTIDMQTVQKIADLAKLTPDDKECGELTEELEGILKFVEQLKALSTEEVAPLHHVLDIRNIFREDQSDQSLSAERALQNAPARKDDFFLVPKVIKNP